VTTASSLDECIKLLKGTRYNVVLVDFMVQGINAEEVVEKIKDMNEDIPVYAISPDSLKGEDYYINLGYDGYLSKPVDGKLLERIISKHLPDEIKD
jgi:CheY-like chemotaxis protein